eukprot:9196187-Ditylum_brightwellii.AAC.1
MGLAAGRFGADSVTARPGVPKLARSGCAAPLRRVSGGTRRRWARQVRPVVRLGMVRMPAPAPSPRDCS